MYPGGGHKRIIHPRWQNDDGHAQLCGSDRKEGYATVAFTPVSGMSYVVNLELETDWPDGF